MESKEKQKEELEELRIELSQQEMEESAKRRDEVRRIILICQSIYFNKESRKDLSYWMLIKNNWKIKRFYCGIY